MFRVKGYRHIIYIYIYIIYYSPFSSVISKRSYEFYNFFKVISSFVAERSKRNSTWEREGFPSFLLLLLLPFSPRKPYKAPVKFNFGASNWVCTRSFCFHAWFFSSPPFIFFFFCSTSIMLFIYYIEIRYTGNIAVFLFSLFRLD